MLLCCLLTAVATLAPRDAAPQERSDYARLVREYASGREEPVAALAVWQHADVERAVKTATTQQTLTPRELISAAVLHVHTGMLVLDLNPYKAVFHVDTARSLLAAAQLRVKAGEPDERARVDRISQRLHAFAVSMFTTAALINPSMAAQAQAYAREGLRLFPGDALLYFVRGTIYEMSIQIGGSRDLRRGPVENPRAGRRIEEQLKPAVDNYMLALHADPHLAAANLHLGWVRLFLNDDRARPALEAAAADAGSGATRYLAHLFLGGFLEKRNELEAAGREYEAALAAGRYQTVFLALSRVEDALGHRERARDYALGAAQLHKNNDDPWWDYKAYFEREMLAWLITEARRP